MGPCPRGRGRAWADICTEGCHLAILPPDGAGVSGAAGYLCHGGSSWLGRWEQGGPSEPMAWWHPGLMHQYPRS